MNFNRKVFLFGLVALGSLYISSSNVSAATFTQSEAQKVYEQAGEKYQVDPKLIESLHYAASNKSFDTLPATEKNKAQGPFQISINTWIGWDYKGQIDSNTLHSVELINRYKGIGVDGDGDGKADPSNFVDSAYACANLLNRSDYKHNIQEALQNYSKDSKFIEYVLEVYKKDTSNNDSISSMSVSEGLEQGIQRGLELVGKSPYAFGAGRTREDIENHSFDCSSFVRWVYEQAGIVIDETATTTTWSLLEKGSPIDKNDMKRGDILFFDTYTTNGHVGIYLGNGKFLNDQSTYGVWVDDLNDSYWSSVFNGNVRRII
ncbi:hypothetical protein K5E_21320 [Enterococcus thailandicus]|uniref:C40 family peptidase n=1 Tax=Enterococcus thailandicus TaxID=417368 RepID=UPI00244D82E2|nr:C40 family peptidase [Enterococcus thailandicus]GMC02829.1 hypothetical protein K4E_03420 [Enterococcus thailandicus]GMC09993.1 hypothetical protein K5E_21320 [Enterococcus thailandicus]